MDAGLPLYPVHLFDLFGSGLMIALSFTAYHYARRLRRFEPESVLWTYIFWVCMALAALSLSRGVGHVLRTIFLFSGHTELWRKLAPFSGGLNTIIFVTIAVLTFYYGNIRATIKRVREDAKALALANRQLQGVHENLQQLNQTLEQRVEARTRELRLSEQKFRRLFESSKDLIFFCDATCRINDMNAAGLELLGEPAEDIIGRHLAHYFLDEEKWSRFYCNLNSQGHVTDFEVDWQRQDGARLFLLLSASAIRDESGEMQGCEGIAKDLTHFKQVTDQMIHSENMASVGQLAAGVAHEINTPLGIILGYTQLLEEDFEGNQEVLETLRIMEKQTKICKRIVSDLLKFSRHSVEGVKVPCNINDLVEEVLTMVEHTLNLDHIYLLRSPAPDLPKVVVDPERLRQVLVNIINNAHHAIGKQGSIGVWTGFNSYCREAEIVIGDTGAGIGPETINRIFDPFFTTKGVGKGTGLGLSVSFGIVKDHGGQIEVFSPPRRPELIEAGMRTSFHLLLPVDPVPDERSIYT
jgi:PAS domain S-box-containing protein